LQVKTLQGKLYTVEVLLSDTIAAVKLKLQAADAGPVEAQRLISSGKILEDGQTVEAAALKPEVPLFMVINQAAVKAAEEKRKAEEEKKKKVDDEAKAKAAAEAKAKAAADEAAKKDEKELPARAAAIAKKLAAAKTVYELTQLLDSELKALKAPAPPVKRSAAAAAAGQWHCEVCGTANGAGVRECTSCNSLDPRVAVAMAHTPAGEPVPAIAVAAPAADWHCDACTFQNTAVAMRCEMCGSPNPAAPARAAMHYGGDADLDAMGGADGAALMAALARGRMGGRGAAPPFGGFRMIRRGRGRGGNGGRGADMPPDDG